MNLNSAQADEEADVGLHLARCHAGDIDGSAVYDIEGSGGPQEDRASTAASDALSRPALKASAWSSYVSTDRFDAGDVDDELDQVSSLVCAQGLSFGKGIVCTDLSLDVFLMEHAYQSVAPIHAICLLSTHPCRKEFS